MFTITIKDYFEIAMVIFLAGFVFAVWINFLNDDTAIEELSDELRRIYERDIFKK